MVPLQSGRVPRGFAPLEIFFLLATEPCFSLGAVRSSEEAVGGTQRGDDPGITVVTNLEALGPIRGR
uniref:Uncharacterized protein n=1 Tax=Ixodes ricinus TaxID=34613 RepID=A0A6B0TZ25_IXORI